MAERLSTGLRNYLLGGGSWREAFQDGVMKIYSGAAPTSSDDAVTGALLLTVTKSSGTVSSDEASTRGIWTAIVTDAGADDYGVIITVDTVEYTCTITADADDTDNDIASMIAEEINKTCPQVFAIAGGATVLIGAADGVLLIAGRIAGLDISVADDGNGNVAVAEVVEAARSDAIQFAKPASGAMAKASETWSGLIAVSGVAGYYRIVQPDDDGTYSLTAIRKQGSISTSGAELNFANTSLVAGVTHTIDSYSISQPAE